MSSEKDEYIRFNDVLFIKYSDTRYSLYARPVLVTKGDNIVSNTHVHIGDIPIMLSSNKRKLITKL